VNQYTYDKRKLLEATSADVSERRPLYADPNEHGHREHSIAELVIRSMLEPTYALEALRAKLNAMFSQVVWQRKKGESSPNEKRTTKSRRIDNTPSRQSFMFRRFFSHASQGASFIPPSGQRYSACDVSAQIRPHWRGCIALSTWKTCGRNR